MSKAGIHLIAKSVGAWVACFCLALTPALAAGPTSPVGPQGAVGPQSTPGPQGTVGPSTPVGPQSTPGPTSPVGPQPATTTTAASIDQSNSQTGDHSANSNTTDAHSSSTASQSNDATTTNQVGENLNTGSNTASQNTQVGTVQTGAVNAGVTLINASNSNFAPDSSVGTTSLNAGDAGQVVLTPSTDRAALGGTQNNALTGSNSLNTNTTQVSGTNGITQVNRAATANAVTIQATTGGNTLASNTMVGGLQTGDVNVAASTVNLSNINAPGTSVGVDVWNVLSTNKDANIVLGSGNQATGPNSDNTNSASDTSSHNLQVTQLSSADNSIQVNANTGDNNLTNNGSTGDLTTGSTHVNGEAVNVGNDVDELVVVNVMGDGSQSWDGSVQGVPASNVIINRQGNDLTGPQSENQNQLNSTDTSTDTLTQLATVSNALSINADTGHNTLSSNSKVGKVTTGNINILTSVVNLLNALGGQAHHFHLSIINLFMAPHPVSPATAPLAQTAVNTGANTVLPTLDLSGAAPPTVLFPTVASQAGTHPLLRLTFPAATRGATTGTTGNGSLLVSLPSPIPATPSATAFLTATSPTYLRSLPGLDGSAASLTSSSTTQAAATDSGTHSSLGEIFLVILSMLIWFGAEGMITLVRRRQTR